MSAVFPFHILQEHAPKPEFGKPCNNCGLCCRVSLCEAASKLLPGSAPCPALEMHDGKFLCGLILRPKHYFPTMPDANVEPFSEYMRNGLGIGFGCSMDDEVMAVGFHFEDDDAEARSRGDAVGEVQGSPDSSAP